MSYMLQVAELSEVTEKAQVCGGSGELMESTPYMEFTHIRLIPVVCKDQTKPNGELMKSTSTLPCGVLHSVIPVVFSTV